MRRVFMKRIVCDQSVDFGDRGDLYRGCPQLESLGACNVTSTRVEYIQIDREFRHPCRQERYVKIPERASQDRRIRTGLRRRPSAIRINHRVIDRRSSSPTIAQGIMLKGCASGRARDLNRGQRRARRNENRLRALICSRLADVADERLEAVAKTTPIKAQAP